MVFSTIFDIKSTKTVGKSSSSSPLMAGVVGQLEKKKKNGLHQVLQVGPVFLFL
jgi:hypothetical protein